jgi:TetR/AcrR family transcriptional regulator
MKTASSKPRLGSRGQPEESRAAILHAAVREFAEHGIAGARTDAIAQAAHVNKALLYYYFKDKETLYGAVLDHVFSNLKKTVLRALESEVTPGEKVLAYVGAYFDFIAGNPLYPKLVQREMMRAGRGGSPHLKHIVEEYFRPIYSQVAHILHQGIAAGEFRPVDPLHFVPSIVALVVFYFSSAPVMQIMAQFDPMAPERVSERRAAVLDFISAALFRHSGQRQKENASEGP